MKAIGIFRKISGANGTCILQPIMFVATDELAQEIIAHHKGFLQELAQMHVAEITPQGARGVMPIPQLLTELGIMNVELIKMSADVKESNLIVPRTPPVVLQ